MGEAKRRKLIDSPVVYHHTSILRTNQLWMTGEVRPEGKMPPVFHPDLGQMETDARFRREMKDFPPLVWLTKQIAVPRCLQINELLFVGESGERHSMEIGSKVANAIAMQRLALGFRLSDFDLTWWPDHAGFNTVEGRALNETGREAGDNPRDWYVSEKPLDLMQTAEVWFSRDPSVIRLKREDWYLADIRRMVQLCRDTPGAFIPPTWLKPEQARELAKRLGVPISDQLPALRGGQLST